jgi:hypothetical protein
VNPSSLTLVQGADSQSVTVNLTRSDYTDNITLATSTLPGGVTATYTQPGTGTSGSITLEAASNATQVSNQTITITASGTGVSSATATFSLTVNTAFSLSVSPTSSSVTAGGTVTYALNLTPEGGFNQQVSVSCTGAPSAATCSVSPDPITVGGNSAAKATVTVTTTAPSLASPTRRLVPPGAVGPLAIPWVVWLLMLATLSFLVAMRRRRVRFSLAVLAATALLTIAWVACGGGGGATTTTSGTPAGTYTLTLTATSGSLTNSTTVSLTVN